MIASIGRSVALVSIILSASRPALAVAPAGRYTVSSGTVYDGMTRLTWQQVAPSTTYTWAAAKTYCAGAGAALGGSGWRLPTFKELLTLADYSVAGYAFDPTAFPSPQPTTYWSASLSASATASALTASFGSGFVNRGSSEQSKQLSVRCVR